MPPEAPDSGEPRPSPDDIRDAPDSVSNEPPSREKLLEQVGNLASANVTQREELDALKGENARLAVQNEELKSTKDTRDALNVLIPSSAAGAWRFLYVYCGVALAILVLEALPIDDWFAIDALVLSVLVGSTAVTVVGLVAIVLSGVFRTREK